MAQFLDSLAVLLFLAALFGYLNHRFIRLPRTIGLLLIALFASLGVLAIDTLVPGMNIGSELKRAPQAL